MRWFRLLVLALGWMACAHQPTPNVVLPAAGAVATANHHATKAALQVLREGGNAIDAAITAVLVLGVTEPYSAGLGGGGFALVHHQGSGTTRAIDFRERAPLRASRDMYLDPQGNPTADSVTGWLAAGVPGTAAGLSHLHGLHSTMTWERLVAPAQQLAKNGFQVTPLLEARIQRRLADLLVDPEMQRLFAPGGKPLKAGQTLIQTDLAKTLERMAKNGRREWIDGATTRRIVEAMKANEGLIQTSDFAAYQVKERTPIEGSFQGHRILSFPPPSSGGIHLVQMLRMLEASGLPGTDSIDFRHRWIETMRRAYQDRARHLGDPDFYPVPQEGLLSPSHLKALRQSIKRETATPSQDLNNPQPQGAPSELKGGSEGNPHHETSHLSVLDRRGNAVSLTFTINTTFGAAVMAPGTGVILNNEMDDFSAKPGVPNAYGLVGGEANAIAPGKTPLSSMTPTLVFGPDNRLRLVIGSPGGSTIITTVLQTILQTLHLGRTLAESLALPRFHHQWLPDCVLLDRQGLNEDMSDALKELGHCLKVREDFGNAQGIMIDDKGRVTAASDPRGEGTAEVVP